MKDKKFYKAVKRPNSPLFTSLIRTGAVLKNPRFSYDNCLRVQIVLNEDVYAEEGDFFKLRDLLVDRCRRSISFLKRMLREIDKECIRYLVIMDRVAQQHGATDAPHELRRAFSVFVRESQMVAGALWPPLGVEDWIIKTIEQALGKIVLPTSPAYQEILQKLIRPFRVSGLEGRHRAMMVLAAEIAKQPNFRRDILKKSWSRIPLNKLKRKVEKIFHLFAWAEDSYLIMKIEPLKHFIVELRQMVKNKPCRRYAIFMKEEKRAKQEKLKLMRELRFSSSTRTLIRLASDLPYFRLRRREVIIEGAYRIRSILWRIAKTINVKDIMALYYFETLDALSKPFFKRLPITGRKRGHGFIVDKNKIYLLPFQLAGMIRNNIEGATKNVSEIKGMPAYIGIVRGTVKILHSSKESFKVKLGDILVTSMTMPDYVPAMKVASAFVTDEGGISCHAAIVSRELKKPCIIGTKIATQVLKDGDLVEVDATKGIVKKLK
ncbi:MAG: PEP-utilizing enzyme [Patescibacteria group bacterium]